jgi:hypothetical protein
MAHGASRGLSPKKRVILSTLLWFSLQTAANSQAFAETRRDCERNVRQTTALALGAGIGTIGGTLAGMSACAPLLAAAPLDLGISTGLCVFMVGVAGSITGTALAEASTNEQLKKCDRLAQ